MDIPHLITQLRARQGDSLAEAAAEALDVIFGSHTLSMPPDAPASHEGLSEAEVSAQCLLRAGEMGVPLFRNNSGACKNPENGNWVRYGLGNVSKRVNAKLKSGDYIGIHPGTGRIINIDMKRSGWKYDPLSERDAGQNRFNQLIIKNGGIAGFASSVEEFERILDAR